MNQHPCNVSPFSQSQNLAELLLEVKADLMSSKDQLVRMDEYIDLQHYHLTRIKLALDFCKLPKGTIFRAIIEDWDQLEIVQAVY